ncbi:transforming growth factor-beta-induced protein ig-h3-like [Physella acuta]|uniref:transforming growth factor-beta-induced protein ig-h3-like n=1 Tax=Physella acuta TaxID=109671 RepID=UPI0027DE1DCD|nr:transforming growth factor-beta-induced protein ig-h3-like [Physella acuta]
MPLTYVTSCLLMLVAVLGAEAKGRTRRSTHNTPPGPNMCKVQHVLGSTDKYFTHCVAKHLKVICERPTYERWECCPGFKRKSYEEGCPVEKPLDNMLETSRDLKLTSFLHHINKTQLQHDLAKFGPYTAFIPTDEAIQAASPATVRQLTPKSHDAASLLHYHVSPGRLNISTFRDRDRELVTLYEGKKIRVNKYAYGVATVNCARIIRPDELATNGIIHVIDKVISPLDTQQNILERIQADPRFSQLNLALLVSDMARRLRGDTRTFTLLAPTDQAFARLPTDLMERILSDADTAEKVLQRHIVRGVYCADAIVVSVGLKTLDDSRLLFRCKREGVFVNDAKVVDPDIVASNGVIHGIDQVFIPDSVKNTSQLLREMNLTDFLDALEKSGLNDTLNMGNITIFTPTNKAFKSLGNGYMAALQPGKLYEVVGTHIVPGHVTRDQLVGDTSLNTMAGVAVKLKVKISRNGVTVDRATVEADGRECRDAVIHKVDQVLIPAVKSIQEHLREDRDTSVFNEMLIQSGVSEMLVPDGSYTVMAPTNRALANLDQRQLKAIQENQVRLKKFVQRHVIPRMILKCTIPDPGVYTVRAMQYDETEFLLERGPRKRLFINRHAMALTDDILASNGVLYKLDHVLPCSCERALLNDQGINISDHRYRRRIY